MTEALDVIEEDDDDEGLLLSIVLGVIF